jgi:tetratricopeptide (TPR) repeat protein
LNLGRFEDAVKDCDEVIKGMRKEFHQELTFSFYVRARALIQLKKYKEAMKDYEEYLKFNPSEIEEVTQLKKELLKLMSQ